MDTNQKLPVWRKICFAMGGACFTTTHTVISFFISIFLLEVAQIRPLHVSIILVAGKVWDAVTDPVCGYLVNKTDTRFGKYRPWILFSMPFACGTYFCVWYVPDVTPHVKFVWYLAFICLFQSFQTAFYVPYSSLTMAISNDQKERDSATAYRLVSETMGTLMAVVVQGQIINQHRRAATCGSAEALPAQAVSEGEKWSYQLGAIVIVSVYIICCLFVYFGSKEKRVVAAGIDTRFFDGVREVLTFKPYLLLTLIALFDYLAIAILQGNLALFCTHALNLGGHFANFMMTLLITTTCSMPFTQMCLRRFGKKTTFVAGLIVCIPPVAAHLFVKDNIYVYYVVVVLGGSGLSALLLVPCSMLPDTLDEFYLKTGARKDALFYSYFVFFCKLATGLGLGLSQAALAVGGYTIGACSQPNSVGLTLRLLMGPGPLLCICISLALLYAYPINEDRRNHNKAKLELRYKSTNASETDMPPLLPEPYQITNNGGSVGKVDL